MSSGSEITPTGQPVPVTGIATTGRSELDKSSTITRIIEDCEDLSSGIGMLRNASLSQNPEDAKRNITNGKNRINNVINDLLGSNRNREVHITQEGQGYLGLLARDLSDSGKQEALGKLIEVRARLADLGTGEINIGLLKKLAGADFSKEIGDQETPEVQYKLIMHLGETNEERKALENKTVPELKAILEERIKNDLRAEIEKRTAARNEDGNVDFWGDDKQKLIDQLAVLMERKALDDLQKEFGGDKGILSALKAALPQEDQSRVDNVSPFMLSDTNKQEVSNSLTELSSILNDIDTHSRPHLDIRMGVSQEQEIAEDRVALNRVITKLLGPANKSSEGVLGANLSTLPKNVRSSLELARDLLQEWRVGKKSSEQMRYDLCAPNGILSGLMQLPGVDRGHIEWLFSQNMSRPMGPNPPPPPPEPTLRDRFFF